VQYATSLFRVISLKVLEAPLMPDKQRETSDGLGFHPNRSCSTAIFSCLRSHHAIALSELDNIRFHHFSADLLINE
jgi:hypothetical protein